jgi:hypothetical protein
MNQQQKQQTVSMLIDLYQEIEDNRLDLECDSNHSFFLNITDRSRNKVTTWTTAELIKNYQAWADNTSTTDIVRW